MIQNIKTAFALIICITLFTNCQKSNIGVEKQIWGNIKGKNIYLYTITNTNGMVVKITNFGGIITSILTPDKNGKMDDIVLGYNNLEQYQEIHPSFGAIIGRFASWIENAEFKIDNTTYKLTENINNDILHGNYEFENAVWNSTIINNEFGNGIQLNYRSKDGNQGFPGNVDAEVTYTLSNENDLKVTYKATTDKTTHINLTQHSYFNLSGKNTPIYNHLVKIDADHYIKHDKNATPSRVIAPLKNTSWNLLELTQLGDNIHNILPNGYNHCYVLNKQPSKLKQVAEVLEPESGRTLKVSTTQPGIVFYTSNYLNSSLTGKNGTPYEQYAGLCLETQHYPDTPNQSDFPSTLLKPNEEYKEIAIYHFGIKANEP